jgi:hypothetical protein
MKDFKITLPLVNAENGRTSVTATVKTPKIKTVRQYREGTRQIAAMGADYRPLLIDYNAAIAELETLQAGKSDAPEDLKRIKELTEKVGYLEARLAESDAKQYRAVCHQLYGILEISVDFDEVDWDEVSIAQINEAVSFFQNSYAGTPSAAKS